jgi:hypothetical protein
MKLRQRDGVPRRLLGGICARIRCGGRGSRFWGNVSRVKGGCGGLIWVHVPSAAFAAEGKEVEHVAVFHLAVRAYGFEVAALHHGEALVGCGRHGCGLEDGRFMNLRERADRSGQRAEMGRRKRQWVRG